MSQQPQQFYTGYPQQGVVQQPYVQQGVQQPYVQQGVVQQPYVQQGVQQPYVQQPYVQQGVQQPYVQQPYQQGVVQQPYVQQGVQQPYVQQGMVQQPYVQQGVQQPYVQQGMVQQPYVQQGMVQQPYVQQGMVQQPYVQQGMVQQPMVQQGMVQTTTGLVQQPMVMTGQPMVMGTQPVVMGMGQPVMVANFNPVDAAKELYIAMKGIGTDEAGLIRVLANKTPEQNAIIAVEFEKLYGKSLKSWITSETSGHFKVVLVGLITPIVELKADYLYDAFEGVGTKDHVLMDVITQSYNAELMAIKQTYANKYYGKKKSKGGVSATGPSNALEYDVKDETSGNFEKVMLSLLTCTRDETGIIDEYNAKLDAQTLYDKGEGRLGTDDGTFVRIFTSRSVRQLQTIDKYYRETKKKHSLVQAITSETSGDFKDILIALTKPPEEYWAERIHKAVAGVGTDDQLLIYCILVNRAMKKICDFYNAKYGKSVESVVSGDTSGDYKKALLEIIKFRSKF